jgi:hypothetical protein
MTCVGDVAYALVAPDPTALSTIDTQTLQVDTTPGLPGVDENPKFSTVSRDGGTFFWGDEDPDGFSWVDTITNARTTVDVGTSIAGIALVTLPDREPPLCEPAPLPSCVQGFAAGSLLIKETAAEKEKLIAKLVKGPAASQLDFGNPLRPPCGTSAYALCVYDDQGTLAVSLAVDRAGHRCGGGAAMCWSAKGGEPPFGKGYAYGDAERTSDGIKKLSLRAGTAGKTKILLKARNQPGQAHMPTGLAAALAGTGSATMQLVSSDAACFTLDLTQVKRADATLFKASR